MTKKPTKIPSMQDDALAAIRASHGLTDAESRFLIALLGSPDLSVADAGAAIGIGAEQAKAMFREYHIRAAFREAIQDRNDRLRIVRDAIVMQLYAYTQYDVADLVGTSVVSCDEKDGYPTELVVTLAPNELPDTIRAAVARVERTQWGWKYWLADKVKIQLALLKHFSGQITEEKKDTEAALQRIKVEYFESEDPKMRKLTAGQPRGPRKSPTGVDDKKTT